MMGQKLDQLLHHMLRFLSSAQYYADRMFKPRSDLPKHFAYVCPLCMSQYILLLEEGFIATTTFNKDHFPPESVGGKRVVVVCERCNNTAGINYDNALMERVEWHTFDRAVPNAFLTAKVTIDNVKGMHAIVMKIDKERKVELSLKKDNRKVPPLDEFIERTKMSGDFGMKVMFNGPDSTRVRKALLKTAYLYCFDLWGYNFTLSRMADNIRKVLAGEMEYPYADVGVLQLDESKPLPEGVCFLSNPLEWQSFVVNVPLVSATTGSKMIVAVLIPNPTMERWNNMKHFENVFASGENIDFSFVPLMNGIQQGFMDGYTNGWFQLYKPFQKNDI